MFFDYGKIVGVFGKEAPVMQRRTELKIDDAREEYKKLLSQGWIKYAWLVSIIQAKK